MEYLSKFEASNISTIKYHNDKKILVLTFSNGNIYHYLDVSKDTWDELKAIEFKLRFIKTRIQKKHRFLKLLKS